MTTRPTVYLKLKKELNTRIESGELPSGSMLPGENALAAKYKISRPSVRKALRELESANQIFRIPGKGTFVKGENAGDAPNQYLTIGVDFLKPTSTFNWYYGEILNGMKQLCTEHSCRLTAVNKEELGSLPNGFIDGLVTLRCGNEDIPLIESLQERDIPTVMINRRPSSPGIGYIRVDYRNEAKRGVEFLLKMGHTKIAVIGERSTNTSHEKLGRQRVQGYEDAHKALGCETSKNLQFFSFADDLRTGKLVEFIRSREFSAVFIASGSLLNPFFQAANIVDRERFKKTCILCFDNVQKLVETSGFTVSEIHMPLESMGSRAIEYLIKKIVSGKNHPVIHETVKASLIINNPDETI